MYFHPYKNEMKYESTLFLGCTASELISGLYSKAKTEYVLACPGMILYRVITYDYFHDDGSSVAKCATEGGATSCFPPHNP